MKTTQLIFLVSAAAMCLSDATFGQGMFVQQPKDLGEDLARLLGKATAFSAKADASMKDQKDKALPGMQFTLATLNGNTRSEMDMSRVGGGGSSAEMKQMGMDRMVMIYRPDKDVKYQLFPGMKSYCEMKSTRTTHQEGKESKVEKTELGRETIDGHPCVKWKVLTTDADGKTSESTVWTATDLKDFPIQSEMITDESVTVTTRFKDINQSKPSASLFEPPADYTRYGSMQEMMMGNMQRMMPTEATPNPRRGFGGSE